MYFVDKDKLTQKLAYLQALTDDYHGQAQSLCI